jgi:SMODS and SLOG-associating 2TM effector domain 2
MMAKQELTDADLGIEKLEQLFESTDLPFKSLYEQTTEFARRKVRWYHNRSEKDWRYWVIIRGVSLGLAVVGAIFPLLDATAVFPSLKLSSWGYVVLALAAGIYSIDTFFGYSAGASRNTVTWLKIRLLLAEAEFDLRLAHSQPGNQELVPASIERLKKLRLDIETEIARETTLWVDEFRQQRSELAKQLEGSTRPKS